MRKNEKQRPHSRSAAWHHLLLIALQTFVQSTPTKLEMCTHAQQNVYTNFCISGSSSTSKIWCAMLHQVAQCVQTCDMNLLRHLMSRPSSWNLDVSQCSASNGRLMMQVVPGTQLFLRAHRKFGFSVEEDASPAAMDSSHESQVQHMTGLPSRCAHGSVMD